MKDWLSLDPRCKDCLCWMGNGGGCSGDKFSLSLEACKWYKPIYKKDKEDKMPGGMSLLDFITKAGNQKITKSEFGRIMHDPNATEEEMQEALEALAACDGYENLAD